MPHQCVRCGTFYEDTANELLQGCSCGGHLFFYIKKKDLDEVKKETNLADLNQEQRKEIEDDVFDLLGYTSEKTKPVVLDFESIRVLSPGKYELDLVHLFKKEPLILKLEEGKYIIDLPETFKSFKEKFLKKEK